MSKPRATRKSVHDRILNTASGLFYREGIRNVGIDRIIAESGVAKMSHIQISSMPTSQGTPESTGGERLILALLENCFNIVRI